MMTDNTPYELPPVEDMIPDPEHIIQDIKIQVALNEIKYMDTILDRIIFGSTNLYAAIMTASGLIDGLIETALTDIVAEDLHLTPPRFDKEEDYSI